MQVVKTLARLSKGLYLRLHTESVIIHHCTLVCKQFNGRLNGQLESLLFDLPLLYLSNKSG